LRDLHHTSSFHDVPSIAAIFACLRKQTSVAGESMWKAIAIDRFPHLATVFSLLPDPKPSYKVLLRRFHEAHRATTVSHAPQPEVAMNALDDYIFHYEIFIDEVLRVSWAGKALFPDFPGSNVLLPI
jgi:hypothetical protein